MRAYPFVNHVTNINWFPVCGRSWLGNGNIVMRKWVWPLPSQTLQYRKRHIYTIIASVINLGKVGVKSSAVNINTHLVMLLKGVGPTFYFLISSIIIYLVHTLCYLPCYVQRISQ